MPLFANLTDDATSIVTKEWRNTKEFGAFDKAPSVYSNSSLDVMVKPRSVNKRCAIIERNDGQYTYRLLQDGSNVVFQFSCAEYTNEAIAYDVLERGEKIYLSGHYKDGGVHLLVNGRTPIMKTYQIDRSNLKRLVTAGLKPSIITRLASLENIDYCQVKDLQKALKKSLRRRDYRKYSEEIIKIACNESEQLSASCQLERNNLFSRKALNLTTAFLGDIEQVRFTQVKELKECGTNYSLVSLENQFLEKHKLWTTRLKVAEVKCGISFAKQQHDVSDLIIADNQSHKHANGKVVKSIPDSNVKDIDKGVGFAMQQLDTQVYAIANNKVSYSEYNNLPALFKAPLFTKIQKEDVGSFIDMQNFSLCETSKVQGCDFSICGTVGSGASWLWHRGSKRRNFSTVNYVNIERSKLYSSYLKSNCSLNEQLKNKKAVDLSEAANLKITDSGFAFCIKNNTKFDPHHKNTLINQIAREDEQKRIKSLDLYKLEENFKFGERSCRSQICQEDLINYLKCSRDKVNVLHAGAQQNFELDNRKLAPDHFSYKLNPLGNSKITTKGTKFANHNVVSLSELFSRSLHCVSKESFLPWLWDKGVISNGSHFSSAFADNYKSFSKQIVLDEMVCENSPEFNQGDYLCLIGDCPVNYFAYMSEGYIFNGSTDANLFDDDVGASLLTSKMTSADCYDASHVGNVEPFPPPDICSQTNGKQHIHVDHDVGWVKLLYQFVET